MVMHEHNWWGTDRHGNLARIARLEANTKGREFTKRSHAF